MAGIDRKMDTASGDYIDNGLGSTETTTNALTAIYHQGQTPRGSWFGDGEAGRRGDDIEHGKASIRTARAVEDSWRECLEPLVDEGRITDPEIVVEREGDAIPFEVETTDLQTGETFGLTSILEVNL